MHSWGVDVTATGRWDQNAAHIAAKHGSFLVLDDLKEWGVDLDAEDCNGETPMFHAETKGFTEKHNHLQREA